MDVRRRLNPPQRICLEYVHLYIDIQPNQDIVAWYIERGHQLNIKVRVSQFNINIILLHYITEVYSMEVRKANEDIYLNAAAVRRQRGSSDFFNV